MAAENKPVMLWVGLDPGGHIVLEIREGATVLAHCALEKAGAEHHIAGLQRLMAMMPDKPAEEKKH
jgi:hypothetical protein